MNMIAAAADTMSLAAERGMADVSSDNPDLDYPHLYDMLNKMQEGEMSEGKLGRWLGWMQAAVVAANIGVTLNDMKEINRRWSDV